MANSNIDAMRRHLNEGGMLCHSDAKYLLGEVERLRKILDTPILEPFAEAVASEARHQIYRWGEDHDEQKSACDWVWTLGHLATKAALSALARDWDKAKHHTVTAAALLANWHRRICEASRVEAKGEG